MTIINPNNMPYTPADKPTVSTVSKTTTSITYNITNPNSIQAEIFYEIGDDTPDANNITLAGGASQNVTVSGLTVSTSYILYTQAFTATGYSLVGNYSETTDADALYAFTTHNFTAAGITGRTGPTLAQCRTAYTSASWTQNNSFFNMTTQGIQLWTVPVSGNYYIDALGARGSRDTSNVNSFGARIADTFQLVKGEIIRIVCGQFNDNTSTTAAAGSGGTFIVRSPYNTNASILVIAGGGGGSESNPTQANRNSFGDGNNDTSGLQGIPPVSSTGSGAGGTGGAGGGSASSDNCGGGGGGFFSDGTRNNQMNANGGTSFINGATGGTGNVVRADGGFGGGGGSHGNGGGPGGGGGYSGGGGGDNVGGSIGGGGGSYVANGLNINRITNRQGNNTTNGSVTITKL
jgi:hypothetical protein